MSSKTDLTPLERDAAEARKRGMTYGQYKSMQHTALEQWQRRRKKRKKKRMDMEDLIKCDGFPRRLRIGMAIADIQICRMADEIGMCSASVSNIKSGKYTSSAETRAAMMEVLERHRPGTLDEIRAAEKALITKPPNQPLLRWHDLQL